LVRHARCSRPPAWFSHRYEYFHQLMSQFSRSNRRCGNVEQYLFALRPNDFDCGHDVGGCMDNRPTMNIHPPDVERDPVPHILSTSFSSAIQLTPEQLDPCTESVVRRQLLLNLVDRVDHGRMVTAAEQCADLDQGKIEQLADQVHGYLARNRKLL